MKVRYINYKSNGVTETVEEFPYNTKADRLYFRTMLKEYNMAMGNCYGSQRACKGW